MSVGKNSPEDTSRREILITRVFHAPRTLVFDAWLDPVHVARWWGPRGFTITTQSMDMRPGGTWRFIMHGPDGTDYPNVIAYREVVRPERIVYAHGSGNDNEPGQFVTTVTLEDQGKQTKLTMRAVFRTPEERDFVVKNYGAIEGGNQTLDRFGEQLANLGATIAPFTLSREFDAPRDLLFQIWTDREHLERWWGPKGFKVTACTNDLRPGGAMHYGLRTPDGKDLWGKWVYRDILRPSRLVVLSSFADAQGAVVPHPFNPTWPLQLLLTVDFVERDGRTTVTVRWVPLEATDMERKTFDDNRASMTGGWGGTFDQLGEYLGRLPAR